MGLLEGYCTAEATLLESRASSFIASHYSSENTVTFELMVPADVTAMIYDATGRTVASPFSGNLDAGRQTVGFGGESYSAGMDFYSVTANGETATGKLLQIP